MKYYYTGGKMLSSSKTEKIETLHLEIEEKSFFSSVFFVSIKS